MISKPRPAAIFLILILLFVLVEALTGEDSWLDTINPMGDTVESRFPPPPGYKRLPVEMGSLGQWLRNLPLFPKSRPVHLVDGSLKINQSAHLAVVDLDVIQYQQCADSIIRLMAEFFWSTNQSDKICFRFTSGDLCCWNKWSQGWRPVVSGSKVTWVQNAPKDASRENFRQYLQKVFEYAGTISLKSELRPVKASDLTIGDVILQPGSPGHAVMILDQVQNAEGQNLYLLGQSFMPSQEFHVLKNPASESSPWYNLQPPIILTPEWRFKSPILGRFKLLD